MDDRNQSSDFGEGWSGSETSYYRVPYAGYNPPPYRTDGGRRRGGAGGTLVALVLAVLVGAGIGHFLWQPAGGPGPLPGIGSLPSLTPPLGQAAVAAQVQAGIVDVTTRLGNQPGGAAGTGMVLTPTGEVLTNNHVIQGATSITVTDVDNHRSYPANVVGYDRTQDVAVLQVRGATNLRTVALGNSDAVRVGDDVVAIGNAGGVGGTPSHTSGRVTALNQSITASDETGGNAQQLNGLIQVTAELQPGDSGGPLADGSAKVIGMNTAGAQSNRRARGAGFAIPINTAVAVSRQIEAGQSSPTVHIGPTGFLGVQVASSTAGPDSVGNAAGASVVGVQPGSPADAAGLQAGDTIVSVDGGPVDSSTALQSALSAHHPGDRVTLSWVDPSGRQRSGSAQLAVGPPD
jgi:S1-C subfamily serine protease